MRAINFSSRRFCDINFLDSSPCVCVYTRVRTPRGFNECGRRTVCWSTSDDMPVRGGRQRPIYTEDGRDWMHPDASGIT